MKIFIAALAMALGVVLIHHFYGLYKLGQLDAAIATVHELVDAEAKFARAHAERGYTCSLFELADGGWIDDERMDKQLIKTLATTGKRSGFSFEIRGCQKVDGKPGPSYKIIARPLSDGDADGRDNVCAYQSGIVRFYDPQCNQK
jgi:hypothetical protein